MSRIGKKPVFIPENVQVQLHNNTITVKGPKGSLNLCFDKTKLNVKIENSYVVVTAYNKTEKESKALWGLTRKLIANAVEGVTKGFEKKLVVEGVGYKANVKDNKIILNVGYSKPVELQVPNGITASVKDNVISISGIDKYLVGEFAAIVRNQRPPDPYRGKGIRYVDEKLKFKVGKTGV